MGGISVLLLMGIISAMFYIFIATFLLLLIYLLITYTFESFALMRMSQKVGEKLPILAWIPGYNKYLLGKLAGSKSFGIVLAIVNLFTIAMGLYCYFAKTSKIEHFGIFLLSVAIGFLLDNIVSHKLYKKVTQKYADILTVFSVLSLGMLRPVFLFAIRNKQINLTQM